MVSSRRLLVLFWKVTIEGLIVILSRERALTGLGLGRQRGVLGGEGETLQRGFGCDRNRKRARDCCIIKITFR